MPEIYRVATEWTGFAGSPGLTQMYFEASSGPLTSEASAAVANVRTFWNSISDRIPPVVSLQVQASVECFDVASGAPITVLNATPAAVVTGTSTGDFATPAGGLIQWRTGQVIGRRFLSGRTFLVPLGGTTYDALGTLDDACIADLLAAANVLIAASPSLDVWHKPVNQTGGIASHVVSAVVPDRAAVLRSRRD